MTHVAPWILFFSVLVPAQALVALVLSCRLRTDRLSRGSVGGRHADAPHEAVSFHLRAPVRRGRGALGCRCACADQREHSACLRSAPQALRGEPRQCRPIIGRPARLRRLADRGRCAPPALGSRSRCGRSVSRQPGCTTGRVEGLGGWRTTRAPKMLPRVPATLDGLR